MNFETLKEQIKDQLAIFWGQIQESSAYNSARERYETLTPNVQKALLIGVIALTAFIVLSIPYSYFSSSSASMAEYEENKNLIRELLRISRSLKELPPLPPGMSADQLRTEVERTIDTFSLVQNQKNSAELLGTRPAGGIAPPSVDQVGVSIRLKDLNLTQILDIGHRLQTLSSTTKVMGMEIEASKADPHYFDVVFKIVNFSLPRPNIEADEEPAPNTRGSRGPRGGSNTTDETGDNE